MTGSTDKNPSAIAKRLSGVRRWVGSIRHWELLVLMLFAAAVLLGYFVGSLLVLYRLFEFVSLEVFIGLTVVAIVLGTWGLTKWEMRKTRAEVSLLPPSDAPQVHQYLEEVSAELGMSKPELYVIGDGSANAFALGTRWDGMIVVHSGLFEILDDDEMAAVVGHELAHLYYCDSLLAAAGMQFERFIRKIGRIIAFVFLTIFSLGMFLASRKTEKGARALRTIESVFAAPIMLSQNAFSRYREFVADSTSATLLGDASPMISALAELEDAKSDETDRLSPVNPVDRSRRLLRTHPSFDRRRTLLQDDFERERDGFVPFYEGATLGTFTKFGLTAAPLFVVGLFIVGIVLTLDLPLPRYVTDPTPGVALAMTVFVLLWFAAFFAFPWAMLFAPGGRPVFGFSFLVCLVMTFFTGTVGRVFPVVEEIDLIAPLGYIAMTLISVVYIADATRVLVQRSDGGLLASTSRVGWSGLRTTGTAALTAHLSIAHSRLLQGCLLLTAIGLYLAESTLSWVLGVYLLLTVFTDSV